MSKSDLNQLPIPRYAWALPLLALVGIAYFTQGLDLSVSNFFYDRQLEKFPSNPVYDFITKWGVLPAMVMAVGALSFFTVSYIYTRWRKWRPHALLLILPMALGAGVITHALLKDHWGRPRPRQVENFGGEYRYMAFYQPNLSWQIKPLKSFPCGHCTMGFYFFTVALLCRRLGSKPLFIVSMLLAFVLGIALSIARIAQGGHFLSDTIASALIMWLVAASCDWLLFDQKE